MLKINYPEGEDRKAFENDYLKLFGKFEIKDGKEIFNTKKEAIFKKFREDYAITHFDDLKEKCIETILKGSFKDLQEYLHSIKIDTSKIKGLRNELGEKSFKGVVKKVKDNIKQFNKDEGKNLEQLNTDFIDEKLDNYKDKFPENSDLRASLKELVKLERLKSIFSYSNDSGKIRDFFKKYQAEMKLNTCYYCNIDHINYFEGKIDLIDQDKFDNDVDFWKNANEEELEYAFGKSNENIKKLIKHIYDTYPLETSKEVIIEKLRDNNKMAATTEKLENFSLEKINTKSYGLFQLDHFIGKAAYPIFALSLYNFVPSCATCNATLKGTKELTGEVSPTSDNYNYDEFVKFRLLFDEQNNTETSLDTNKIKTQLRYIPDEDNSEKYYYSEYEKVFKTNERYAFHKRVIDELVQKKKRYPQSRIDEMARLLKMSPEKIKKDIFGEEIFDKDIKPEAKPFTKLKRDIAEQIGLEAVNTKRPQT